MFHIVRFVFLLTVCIVSAHPARGEEKIYSISGAISPVFEGMIGNQVYALWNSLIRRKVIMPHEPFFVVGCREKDKVLASKVVASLKRNYQKTADWRFAHADQFKKVRFLGAVFLDGDGNPKALRDAASLIGRLGNEGFLLLFTKESENRTFFESVLKEADLKIQSEMSLKELEFVKDQAGRQIADLDHPSYHYWIFERLVREGMNPVQAHPAADEAIRNFRNFGDSKLLIVGKN